MRSDRATCSTKNPHVATMATTVARTESVSHNSRNRRSRLRRRFAPLLVVMTSLVTFQHQSNLLTKYWPQVAMSKNRAVG